MNKNNKSNYDNLTPRVEIAEISKEDREKIKKELSQETKDKIDHETGMRELRNFSIVFFVIVAIIIVVSIWFFYFFLPELSKLP